MIEQIKRHMISVPVSWVCCGLQQLQPTLVRKHVFILQQQTVSPQLRQKLNQLRRRNTDKNIDHSGLEGNLCCSK